MSLKVVVQIVCIAMLAAILAGCGQRSRKQQGEAKETGMERYEYQSWDGGPHLLLPNSLRKQWRGQEIGVNPLDPATDYGRACAVEGDFGLISIGEGQGLVLAQSPPMVAWMPKNMLGDEEIYILKSWQHTDLDCLIDAARDHADFLDTELRWTIAESGGGIYFAGDDTTNPVAGCINVPLDACTYRILRSDFRDDSRGEVVIVRLEKQR